MPSCSRQALNKIRDLIKNGRPEAAGLPAEEFKKYLDPDDRFFDQINGGDHVNQKHSGA